MAICLLIRFWVWRKFCWLFPCPETLGGTHNLQKLIPLLELPVSFLIIPHIFLLQERLMNPSIYSFQSNYFYSGEKSQRKSCWIFSDHLNHLHYLWCRHWADKFLESWIAFNSRTPCGKDMHLHTSSLPNCLMMIHNMEIWKLSSSHWNITLDIWLFPTLFSFLWTNLNYAPRLISFNGLLVSYVDTENPWPRYQGTIGRI